MTTQTVIDTVYSSTPTASTLAQWDANKNLSANNLLNGYATTATAGATTTLVVGSAYQQFFTGTMTQTVTMPVTSTLALGQSWLFVNLSSGNVTIQSSGANTIVTLAPNTQIILICILTSGTTAASWNALEPIAGSGTVNSGTINQLAWYAATGTAVSGLATANNGVLVTSAGGVPSISSTLPAFTTSSITFSPTTGGIVGTTTNDNADAGKVGEYITSSVPTPGTSISSGTDTNLTSISLTAGDWDVWGSWGFQPSVNATLFIAGINTVSATRPDTSLCVCRSATTGLYQTTCSAIPMQRLSLSGTTTVYMVAIVNLVSGTANQFGFLSARRIR